jgi:hypothetical protein
MLNLSRRTFWPIAAPIRRMKPRRPIKDFNEVWNSVKLAGLASEVARLRARFVIKDSDDSLHGAA